MTGLPVDLLLSLFSEIGICLAEVPVSEPIAPIGAEG